MDGVGDPVGNKILKADEKRVKGGNSVFIITYGMGVYRAKSANKSFNG